METSSKFIGPYKWQLVNLDARIQHCNIYEEFGRKVLLNIMTKRSSLRLICIYIEPFEIQYLIDILVMFKLFISVILPSLFLRPEVLSSQRLFILLE